MEFYFNFNSSAMLQTLLVRFVTIKRGVTVHSVGCQHYVRLSKMIVPEREMRGFHGFLDTLQKCRVEDGRGSV